MATGKIRLFTIPNIITLGNLLCGCLAATAALVFGDLQAAFWLIIVAAVLDFLDGFAARLLKSYSALGVQLDSLSDMVSFGFAPSAVLFSMYGAAGGAAWCATAGYAVFIVALFSALRLAKFNIDDRQTTEFIGLPTPACALFIAAAGWLHASGAFDPQPVWIVVAAAVLALLLICPVRMFSLKLGGGASRTTNIVRLTFAVAALASLAIFRIAAIPFIIAAYVAVSVVMHVACPKRIN